MTRRPRVVVVGGGLSGLATAWWLRASADVVVLEAGDRFGGQIRTIDHAGVAFDVGADAFLARRPAAEELWRALGLGDEDLVPAATSRVLLWTRGRLRPLPTTVLGAPADVGSLLRSGALGPLAAVRAAAEPLLPRRHVAGDRSVADLVGERFGRAVVDVLVEPLLGGVYAGAADRLSAQAAAPAIWDAAQAHRSLLRGLAAQRARSVGDTRPVFRTVRGGLGRVVDALVGSLGASALRGSAVDGIRRRDGGGFDVEVRGVGGRRGTVHAADELVVALPAARAAALLAPLDPDLGRELGGIRTASVGVVALAYARADARLPAASGVLVPRTGGRLVKAVTIGTRKWPHHAAADRLLVRASVGRVDDDRALRLDDDELAARVDAEVRELLRLPRPATHRTVVRWPDALPQYDVGHLARVERIRAGVRALGDDLTLVGAAYDGVGLSARAAEAASVAASIRARLQGAKIVTS